MRQRDFIRVQSFETPRARTLRLAAEAADEFGVDMWDIMGPTRLHAVCNARFWVWAQLRRAGYSFPQIGRIFDRDHTTVMHGVRKMGVA